MLTRPSKDLSLFVFLALLSAMSDPTEIIQILSDGFTGWIVPPMSVRVVRLCEDVGSHLIFALRGGVLLCAEAEAGLPTWWS